MRIAWLLLCFIAIPINSFAASPLSRVSTSVVNEGELLVEWRAGFTRDHDNPSGDKRFRMRQHLDYGFTDWYALRLVVAQDKRDGDNLEHQSVSMEHRVQLLERGKHGWDAGFRLIYAQQDGDKAPNEAAIRLIAQRAFGDGWEFRHNTQFSHELGEDSQSGLALEWRHMLSRNIPPLPGTKKLSAGVELFNDYGRLNALSGYCDQDHQIGPALTGSFDNSLFFQLGYRHGISRAAPDHLMKFFVGFTF